jgi:hypothetical protein
MNQTIVKEAKYKLSFGVVVYRPCAYVVKSVVPGRITCTLAVKFVRHLLSEAVDIRYAELYRAKWLKRYLEDTRF